MVLSSEKITSRHPCNLEQFESSSRSLQPPFQSLADGSGILYLKHTQTYCKFKSSWFTHLQYPEPLDISLTTLTFRLHCKQQSRRNTTLLFADAATGPL